ncbi:MAG: PQQ-binding-like beta-propeller repeat protein, partial [Planctomycetes bacterium]|nr:PQQ-binding-like beta-propeller repeat protein [Planctomycetota bacterium]
MTRIISSLCVLIAIASSAMAATPDWPGWLGPNRNGKSLDTGLLKQWPDEGPKLLWKVDGIGVGFSSVAVTGGKVYITGDRDGKLTLSALDLNGKPLGKIDHGQGRGGPDGSRATPVIDNGNLYLLGGSGLIGCYDAANGKQKWSHTAGDFGGSPGGWGYAESVLIY